MALVPKGKRQFRDSIRFHASTAQPLSIDDKVNPYEEYNFINSEQPAHMRELAEWKSFGEMVAAEQAEKETKEWEEWAADNFPIFGGYTPTEMSALEDRYAAAALAVKERRNGFKKPMSRGSTPSSLFFPVHGEADYSHKGRGVYNMLKRILAPHVLKNPDKFTAVLRGINGNPKTGPEGYLHKIRRENPAILMERGLVEDVAMLVHKLMPHYAGNAAPDEEQSRFSMLVSDIEHYIPGVKHALNVLQLRAFSQNGLPTQASAQDNGNLTNGHGQKPQYINNSRDGWRIKPAANGNAIGNQQSVVVFSPGVQKGLDKVLSVPYNPLLPGIM